MCCGANHGPPGGIRWHDGGRRRAAALRDLVRIDMTTQSQSAVPAKCLTCEMLAQAPLACTDCHQLLNHVQGADYFELFGMPRRFDLDAAELNRRYLAISSNIHPDKFATAGNEMQSFALRASAAINKAFNVLKNPRQRAEYLLETAGGKSAADDKRVPPDLLTSVMMLREEIDEAKSDGDTAALDSLRATISRRRDEADRKIAELSGELTGSSDESKEELRMHLNAAKYIDNLLAQLA